MNGENIQSPEIIASSSLPADPQPLLLERDLGLDISTNAIDRIDLSHFMFLPPSPPLSRTPFSATLSSNSIQDCSASVSETIPLQTSSKCDCCTSLLKHLINNRISQLRSRVTVVTALKLSKAVTDKSSKALACQTCSTDLSTILVVCQAIERTLSVFKLGRPCGDLDTNGYKTGTQINSRGETPALRPDSHACKSHVNTSTRQSTSQISHQQNSSHHSSPICFGRYAVTGADSRSLMRMLVLSRIREFDATLCKLQQIVREKLESMCQKICHEVIADCHRSLSSVTEWVKVWL